MFVEPGISSGSELEDEQRLEDIVRQGPAGTVAVAGAAVVIVVAIWIAFYVLVFVPRA